MRLCLLVAGLANALPALSQPVEPFFTDQEAAAADAILVGRVTRTWYPDGMPQSVKGGEVYHERATVRVDRVLKGKLTPGQRRLDIDALAHRPVADQAYGMFFLHRRPDGSYATIYREEVALVANPAAANRPALSPDPLTAVALELVDVLAAPRQILSDPKLGVRYWPGLDPATEADQIDDAAAEALYSVPAGLVLGPLQKAADSNDILIRLWTAAVLLEHGDGSRLASLVPTLMAPEPYMQQAYIEVATELWTRPEKIELPSLILLLQSNDTRMRQGAVSALRQIGGPEIIRPLALLVRQEQDPQILDWAVSALCRNVDKKAAFCSNRPIDLAPPETRAAMLQWAMAILDETR